MRRIKRTCATCGKKFMVSIENGKVLPPTKYYGRLAIPVKGTGVYRKTREKAWGATVAIWTGKYRYPEYWECGCEDK